MARDRHKTTQLEQCVGRCFRLSSGAQVWAEARIPEVAAHARESQWGRRSGVRNGQGRAAGRPLLQWWRNSQGARSSLSRPAFRSRLAVGRAAGIAARHARGPPTAMIGPERDDFSLKSRPTHTWAPLLCFCPALPSLPDGDGAVSASVARLTRPGAVSHVLAGLTRG